jgi:hypothetical protein
MEAKLNVRFLFPLKGNPMLTEIETLDIAIAVLPAVQNMVDEAIAERRAAHYSRPRLSHEEAIAVADRRISEIQSEASARAKARCLAKINRGEPADSDQVFAEEMHRSGMPAAGHAIYKRRREYPSERQIDQEVRSAAAREECEQLRAAGKPFDSTEVFHRHGL